MGYINIYYKIPIKRAVKGLQKAVPAGRNKQNAGFGKSLHRMLGGDVVGMYEATAAVYMKFKILGLGLCFKHVASGINDKPLSHEEVFAGGEK
jgi:hypothetical protein